MLIADGVALPPLRLELHVYYRDRPNERFVIVNGGTYREGEALREGPRVVTIEPTGVVLEPIRPRVPAVAGVARRG